MIPFSVLDLAPITEGADAARAFRNSLDLARHVEKWNYRRFWLAEHHSMPGIASAATSVVIAHVAGGTSTIRVGAGGVMLPNHAPLVIAEQFGTLESLYPGRIDLGLGRAPGSDQLTARALRRTLASDPEAFPQDVIELMEYFQPSDPSPFAAGDSLATRTSSPVSTRDSLATRTSSPVKAIPGIGLNIPIWILGSSLFGAQVAAALGLPFAFASHFAPAQMLEALDIYRARFTPSRQLDKPHAMLGFNVFAADTDEEAHLLATSMQQAFVNLRSGRPSRLQPPIPGYLERLGGAERALLQQVLSCSAIGSPATVQKAIEAFIARTGADELMINSNIYDHSARLRSFEITAQVRDQLGR